MISSIIRALYFKKKAKLLSFLATGSEIIEGDVQETNCHFFAKYLSEKGGDIYQHIQVSDRKNEIAVALKYLLKHSDVVIVTGGLGPTSDDTTRFAIAEVTRRKLYFDEIAWSHIVRRLEQVNLEPSDANRQQALFPAGSELYPNQNGTAFGSCLRWKNKIIFMLPGPPKECRPLFHDYVLPTLENENFFQKKKTYRWLTLGLVEGEIATKIDEKAKIYDIETGYCWNYPYLEIKLIAKEGQEILELLKTVNEILLPHVVSQNGENAFEALTRVLESSPDSIDIIDEVSGGEFFRTLSPACCTKLKKGHRENLSKLTFQVSSPQVIDTGLDFFGTVTLECQGFRENHLKYTHKITLPNRGPEILEYIRCYIAWQVGQFLKVSQS